MIEKFESKKRKKDELELTFQSQRVIIIGS